MEKEVLSVDLPENCKFIETIGDRVPIILADSPRFILIKRPFKKINDTELMEAIKEIISSKETVTTAAIVEELYKRGVATEEVDRDFVIAAVDLFLRILILDGWLNVEVISRPKSKSTLRDYLSLLGRTIVFNTSK